MLHSYSSKTKVFESNKAMGCQLATTGHNELVKLFLEPKGSIALHSLPVHVTFFVIKGSGTAIIEDKKIFLSKGDVLEVEAKVNRGWNNTSDSNLEVLVIKQI